MESLEGQLLIAGPTIEGGMFRQAVILVVEHNSNGALGFTLNNALDTLVAEADLSLAELPLFDERIYLGGPVQPNFLTVIAKQKDRLEASDSVLDAIAFIHPGEQREPLERAAKVFIGYAGWAPGQLEAELTDAGSWLVEPARLEDIFCDSPESLWRDTVKRKGPSFAMLSTMPFDPTLN